jgi:hypothetical protein
MRVWNIHPSDDHDSCRIRHMIDKQVNKAAMASNASDLFEQV